MQLVPSPICPADPERANLGLGSFLVGSICIAGAHGSIFCMVQIRIHVHGGQILNAH